MTSKPQVNFLKYVVGLSVHKISKIPPDWKGKDKTVPIAEGIIVHIENFEESTKQLSE